MAGAEKLASVDALATGATGRDETANWIVIVQARTRPNSARDAFRFTRKPYWIVRQLAASRNVTSFW
jgi:hypothetical protein